MKTVVFTIRGQKYGLYYNGNAMFEIQDLLDGDISLIFDVVRGRSKEKFSKLCQIVEIMSAQYVNAMRHLGYEVPDVLRADYTQAVAAMRDIKVLQDMVIEAVNVGLEQEEVDEDREIDLGLIELQKKKRRNRHEKRAVRCAGASTGAHIQRNTAHYARRTF